MPASLDYKFTSTGRWRLALLSGMWGPDLERDVLALADAQPWSKHPQTLTMSWSQGGATHQFYLKVFHPSNSWSAFKDVFRVSRAFRAWRQGVALSEAGFGVPLTIAAGEQRRCRFLHRAFVLTQKLDGQPAHLFLCRLIDRRGENMANAKRTGLREVAELVRRFHEHGFVHGDLVASNIFVSDPGKAPVFYFMDHDRTRRYPSWMPQSLWKRNLIQLNRLPLPGITLQDRMRFFQAYLRSQKLTKGQRRLAYWLERKTRRRRKECDGVDSAGDFRRLMRWPREVSLSSEAKKTG
jgi:hypothetical protein